MNVETRKLGPGAVAVLRFPEFTNRESHYIISTGKESVTLTFKQAQKLADWVCGHDGP